MRRAAFWIFPVVALGGVAFLLWRGDRLPGFTPRPTRPEASGPVSSLPSYQGAPTNEPPRRETREEARTVTTPEVDQWRSTILQRDTRRWVSDQSAVLDRWTESRPHVLRLAESDPDPRVRANALTLILMKKEKETVPFFGRRLREDTHPFVRRVCCKALGEFQAREYAELLRGCLRDSDEKVVAAAREALIALGETP